MMPPFALVGHRQNLGLSAVGSSVVWGKPLPVAPVEEAVPEVSSPPVSPIRVLGALSVVGVVSWALESAAGLGPSVVVVVVAAVGGGGAVRYGHAGRRVALIAFLAMGVTGLGWIELINTAQYGTLALTGAPPLVRWCGTTYEPSGVVTAALSTGPGPTYSKILRTPSGYDVFGVALAAHRSCGTSVPLLVGVARARYAAYDAVTPSPAALVDCGLTPTSSTPRRCR